MPGGRAARRPAPGGSGWRRRLLRGGGLCLLALLAVSPVLAGDAGSPAVAQEARPDAGDAADSGLDRAIGRALFRRAWVPAPSSTRANDGLGPLFDARSCAACHPGAGPGATALTPQGVPDGLGLVLALLRADGTGDPAYGHRLETMTLPGVPAEGVVRVKVRPDGRRVPEIAEPGYGPLDAATGLSLRAAPDLRGRGRLEEVSDATILAGADPDDRDGDGVRGRVRWLETPEGGSRVGRFGWKAAHATLEGQASEAFALDLGLSTPLRLEPWGDCTERQTACRQAPHGQDREGEPEIGEAIVARLVDYLRGLPVPSPHAGEEPAGARSRSRLPAGAALFAATGCGACHRPALPTRGGGEARLFTDVLLHDMGEGLADPVGQPGAGPRDWRTAPLAGLSLALARGAGLLHDGRAGSVAEAVRWHGGEAAGARARFDALPAAERDRLVAYVSSL
ncbi:thiol oxidoreductase [Ancylobacter lacus]|nr:di-heme oxidoredictase family protein [Ancylobacter lacus]MBS7540284.1 thiol oxidoreductase [Ancylobacter lacus]